MADLIDYTVKVGGADFVIEDGEGRHHHVSRWSFHPYEFFRTAAVTAMQEGAASHLKIDAPTNVVRLMLNFMWNLVKLQRLNFLEMNESEEKDFADFVMLSHRYMLPILDWVDYWTPESFNFEFWTRIDVHLISDDIIEHIAKHDKFLDWLATNDTVDLGVWLALRTEYNDEDLPKLESIGEHAIDRYAETDPSAYDRTIHFVLDGVYRLNFEESSDYRAMINKFIDGINDPAERDIERRKYAQVLANFIDVNA